MANSQFNPSNESQPSDETMPVHFSSGIANLVTRFLSGNVDTNFTGDEETKPFTAEERQRFKLFDKSIEKLMTEKFIHPDPQAEEIANLILRGEEKDVTTALDLVAKKIKKDSAYLDYQVIGTDLLGRKVKGTLLQIAAMAGDVMLREEDFIRLKDLGLVERLARIGKLTNDEVALQLQVITSKEARAANEKRNQRILNLVMKFGKAIIEKNKEYKGKNETKEFQAFCQPIIDEFEKKLNSNTEEVITSGFIFDLTILFQTAEGFKKNVEHFNGWKSLLSDVFWINGFGKLQGRLSSRDAQIIISGLGNFMSGGSTRPERTLTNLNGLHFYDSQLGRDYYLGGYYGFTQTRAAAAQDMTERGFCQIEKLVANKNDSYCEFKQQLKKT